MLDPRQEACVGCDTLKVDQTYFRYVRATGDVIGNRWQYVYTDRYTCIYCIHTVPLIYNVDYMTLDSNGNMPESTSSILSPNIYFSRNSVTQCGMVSEQ